MLYSPDMIRAKLAGIKDVTRRPMKIQPDHFHKFSDGIYRPQIGDKEIKLPCAPGDLLYAREAVQVVWSSNGQYASPGKEIVADYTAGGADPFKIIWPERIKPVKVGHCMPNGCFKEAARIWDEVISVTVERLQDITEDDAIREGVTCAVDHHSMTHSETHREAFARLWDSIYGTWDQNPWVVRIETKNISLTGKPDNL